jgi:hypothetical protein
MSRLAAKNMQFRTMANWVLGLALAANAALVCAQDVSPSEQYARILADADSLTTYNQQLTEQLKSQQSQIALLDKQLVEMDATGAQVVPLIEKMYTSLQEFVASDLPFLDPTQAGPDTRKERMERLRGLMAEDESTPADATAGTEGEQGEANAGAAENADTAVNTDSPADPEAAAQIAAEQAKKAHAQNAERYRRLLEAYQIELDYGKTMAAYKGKLPDGRDADFVRVGRVTLLYRTTDGDESGYWDAEQNKWVVDNDYNKAIENAVLIATKETAPDLVTVPVPAPQEMPL